MVTITTTKKELLATLKYLNVTLKGSRSKAKRAICEITITDGNAAFAVPGAIFNLPCKTQGVAKITVPFWYFLDIIKNHNSPSITMLVENNVVTIGLIAFDVKTTFIEDDRILRTIDFPINYTDKDILLLENQGYTKEELKFNFYDLEIIAAKKRLEQNIEKAYMVLKVYGVSQDEISKLVKSKL